MPAKFFANTQDGKRIGITSRVQLKNILNLGRIPRDEQEVEQLKNTDSPSPKIDRMVGVEFAH